MGDNGKILIFGLLGLGLLFLLTRRGREDYGETLTLRPASSIASHHYTNEETWDIDWNEDGLPKRVTIHRNAVQT